jgi:hypothetical protein
VIDEKEGEQPESCSGCNDPMTRRCISKGRYNDGKHGNNPDDAQDGTN